METEQVMLISVAAIAFCFALLAVIAQWLKADDMAADVEAEVRDGLKRMSLDAEPEQEVSLAASAGTEDTAPQGLADNETALSRLVLGWGGAGMLVGMALGAVRWGAVGATLGGVTGSALAVVGVVVAVVVIDRAAKARARERAAGKAAKEDHGQDHGHGAGSDYAHV